jgi:hypothetical protein
MVRTFYFRVTPSSQVANFFPVEGTRDIAARIRLVSCRSQVLSSRGRGQNVSTSSDTAIDGS